MEFLQDLQFVKIKRINNKKQQGFTLIETIAVIMLVGIISAVLGLAIVQGAKSYVFVKTNVSVSQKAQLAIARMERELQAITEIDPDNSGKNCIRYKRETDLRAPFYFRTIGFYGNSVRMNVVAGSDAPCPSENNPGEILIDNVDVESSSLSYEDQTETTDSPPTNLEELHAIHISLILNRADSDRTEAFNIVINPRNNGMLNAPGSAE